MAETFTPAAGAKMLGVHSNTIRSACAEWAPYLSAGAVPASGAARVLTLQDLARLQVVFDCRREGLDRAATVERVMAAPPAPYIQAAPVAAADPAPLQGPPLAPTAQSGGDLATVAALLAGQAAQLARAEAVAARLERIERNVAGLGLLLVVLVALAMAAGGLLVLVALRVGV